MLRVLVVKLFEAFLLLVNYKSEVMSSVTFMASEASVVEPFPIVLSISILGRGSVTSSDWLICASTPGVYVLVSNHLEQFLHDLGFLTYQLVLLQLLSQF